MGNVFKVPMECAALDPPPECFIMYMQTFQDPKHHKPETLLVPTQTGNWRSPTNKVQLRHTNPIHAEPSGSGLGTHSGRVQGISKGVYTVNSQRCTLGIQLYRHIKQRWKLPRAWKELPRKRSKAFLLTQSPGRRKGEEWRKSRPGAGWAEASPPQVQGSAFAPCTSAQAKTLF